LRSQRRAQEEAGHELLGCWRRHRGIIGRACFGWVTDMTAVRFKALDLCMEHAERREITRAGTNCRG
jgi:hypothetical protein